MGAVTDVTTQKTVEALHRQGIEQRMLDVEETRRQQSEFVDLASHGTLSLCLGKVTC